MKNKKETPNDILKSLMKKGKKSKYKNKKTVYNGILYDSKREAEYACKLDCMLKKGLVKEIKRQVVFPYEIKYIAGDKSFSKKGKYIADFVVTFVNGQTDVIDVKGYKTAKYKRDVKIMKKLFNIDIVEK